MAVNHECLASLPEEVKKLQQMSDTLFAQMQGCDPRRLGETTYRNGCLGRPNSQSASVTSQEPGIIQKSSNNGDFIGSLAPEPVLSSTKSSSSLTHSPNHGRTEEASTGPSIRSGPTVSPPAFVNPLDYSTHPRLTDPGGHTTTRVSPGMKSGSSCASYIGSFSSSSSPSPSLPDTCSAPFHPEQNSTWKTLAGTTPPFHAAKKPCLATTNTTTTTNTGTDFAAFRNTVHEIPIHNSANAVAAVEKTPAKRRGRLRKDAFPTKGCLIDTSEPSTNGTANDLSTRTTTTTTTTGSKKVPDTLKTSLKRHMPGALGVTNSTRGTVSTAAYKYLTWREKDRRRRFREEWKHLWLVIPHGRYEVMCLVCHKVMTQRKLDTIKRHTVRRHVELLGMPEIERQNLFEQLIRQHNLMNTVESNPTPTTVTSRTSRKTPDVMKLGQEKDVTEAHTGRIRSMDTSSWQPEIMSQISSLTASQSNSTALGFTTTATTAAATRAQGRDTSTRTGLNSRAEFSFPHGGLENGPSTSGLPSFTSGSESTMFKRAFEELLAESQQHTNAQTGSGATHHPSSDSTRSLTSISPSHLPSPSFPGSLPFPTPLSPNALHRTALNYSKANSVTSSFTQLLEQLANSRNKFPPSDSRFSPPGGRSTISSTGLTGSSQNPFHAICDTTQGRGADSMVDNQANSMHEERFAQSALKTESNSLFHGRVPIPTGSEHRSGTGAEVLPESCSSNSNLAMATAAAAAAAQSLMRLPPHLWPHSLPGASTNRPPELNPMLMATWAAAAMAAAVSGTGNPLTDSSVSLPTSHLPLKLPDAPLPPNALKLPYPPAPFPFHPVAPVLPSGPGKFPTRGPGPSDLRHGSPYGNLMPNDGMHTKYSETPSSTRATMNKTMHGHSAPIDFTKVPPHPWNWAFGIHPSTVPSGQASQASPLLSSSTGRSSLGKSQSDLSGTNTDSRNSNTNKGRSEMANTVNNAPSRPNEFPTTMRPTDRFGALGSHKDASPSGSAPCLVCAWEDKRRDGLIADSDIKFAGLDTISHSCRPSSRNPHVSSASVTTTTSACATGAIGGLRSKPFFDMGHTGPLGPWPVVGSEANSGPKSPGTHSGLSRPHPTSTCDPASLPELMKSVPPWFHSLRPPFGPPNLDPCMMLYCTELLRQHCRSSADLNPSVSLDRQSTPHVTSPRFSPSSRGSTGRTMRFTGTGMRQANHSVKSFTGKATAELQSSPCPNENVNTSEPMEQSERDMSRDPYSASASSPGAPSPSSPLDVCTAANPDTVPTPDSHRRDCLSPLWWVNLTNPNEPKREPCVKTERETSAGPAEHTGPLNMHMLRLAPGQDLRACLSHYVTSRQLNGAFVVTCCGSVLNARLRLANLEVKEFSGPFEIVSLVGTLAFDGQPHLHIALADSTGTVLGGHLLGPSRIHTTAEVVLGVMNFHSSAKSALDCSSQRKELKRPASTERTPTPSTRDCPMFTDHPNAMDVSASQTDEQPKKLARNESQLRIRLIRKIDPATGFKELAVESTGSGT